MKKTIIVLVVTLVVGITYLVIAGGKWQEIKTEVEISAPQEKVWSIVSDINNWQSWNPNIKESQGTAAVGTELMITMVGKEEGKDGPKYNPVITSLEQPKFLSWRAHMLAEFFFTNDKIIQLEKTGSGTRVIHIERFKGLLAPISCGQMEAGVPPMLNSMNQALKDLAEK